MNTLASLAADFAEKGYAVVPRFVEPDGTARLRQLAEAHLTLGLGPLEYESELGYPGAPLPRDETEGRTARRLLSAISRGREVRTFAGSKNLLLHLQACFAALSGRGGKENKEDTENTDAPGLQLSQAHHNCFMTKQPGSSSVTLWHQDNRFWSFQEPNLITAWLALGREDRGNGCLRVIPGSHLMTLPKHRYDRSWFLRPDLPENKPLLGSAERVELAEGDLLLFHSRLLHAAGRNLGRKTKFSLVFTYHEAENQPLPDTRSARLPGIPLPVSS